MHEIVLYQVSQYKRGYSLATVTLITKEKESMLC